MSAAFIALMSTLPPLRSMLCSTLQRAPSPTSGSWRSRIPSIAAVIRRGTRIGLLYAAKAILCQVGTL